MGMETAKKIFFDHDGSGFYMSRNDMESVYREFHVPAAMEQQWLNELTLRYRQRLADPGNWWSVNFFIHHSDYNHLDAILSVSPKGKMWEKCAFLEFLFEYGKHKSFKPEMALRALDYIIANGQKLLSLSRSEKSRERITAIITKAQTLKKRRTLK